MIDKYLVVAVGVDIDSYALFLRREGYVAYVENSGTETFLFTDCIISSISFQIAKEN
jgi:hypothetical protein